MAKHHTQTGFTLTELAITTAVVAVLFMILGTLFRNRLEHEQNNIGCASNLKQLGLAFIQYSQDADEKLPPGVNVAGNGWAGQLYPYLKVTSTYKCPYDPHEGSYISYAENKNIVKQKLNKFAAPMSTIALYEATTLGCDPSTPERISMIGLVAPQNSTRHDSRTFALNFLMADGHVKSLMPEQVSGGANAVSVKALPQGHTIKTFAVK